MRKLIFQCKRYKLKVKASHREVILIDKETLYNPNQTINHFILLSSILKRIKHVIFINKKSVSWIFVKFVALIKNKLLKKICALLLFYYFRFNNLFNKRRAYMYPSNFSIIICIVSYTSMVASPLSLLLVNDSTVSSEIENHFF